MQKVSKLYSIHSISDLNVIVRNRPVNPFNMNSYNGTAEKDTLMCQWLEHHIKKYLAIQYKLKRQQICYGVHADVQDEELKRVPLKILHINWDTERNEEWEYLETLLGLRSEDDEMDDLLEQGEAENSEASKAIKRAFVNMEITYIVIAIQSTGTCLQRK